MKNGLAGFVLILLTSASAFGFDTIKEDLCRSMFQSKPTTQSNKTPIGAKLLLKFIFSPESIVEIKGTNIPESLEIQSLGASKKILLNFIGENSWTAIEAASLKKTKSKFKKQNKHLRRLKITEMLKSLESYDSCLAYLDDPVRLRLLTSINETYAQYLPLAEREARAQASTMMSRQISSFRDKGWTVVSALNINDAHRLLNENQGATILIVAHASPEGELVDEKRNKLPKSFFKNITVMNLIIYSCHPLKVKDYYGIQSLPRIRNYFYPQLSDFASSSLDTNKIPMNSLGSVQKRTFSTALLQSQAVNCSISSALQDTAMGVFLNKTYLGGLSETIRFDCSLLKTQNTVEVYSLDSEVKRSVLGLSQLTLNDNTHIDLREHTSRATNTHIVSKGTLNL